MFQELFFHYSGRFLQTRSLSVVKTILGLILKNVSFIAPYNLFLTNQVYFFFVQQCHCKFSAYSFFVFKSNFEASFRGEFLLHSINRVKFVKLFIC